MKADRGYVPSAAAAAAAAAEVVAQLGSAEPGREGALAPTDEEDADTSANGGGRFVMRTPLGKEEVDRRRAGLKTPVSQCLKGGGDAWEKLGYRHSSLLGGALWPSPIYTPKPGGNDDPAEPPSDSSSSSVAAAAVAGGQTVLDVRDRVQMHDRSFVDSSAGAVVLHATLSPPGRALGGGAGAGAGTAASADDGTKVMPENAEAPSSLGKLGRTVRRRNLVTTSSALAAMSRKEWQLGAGVWLFYVSIVQQASPLTQRQCRARRGRDAAAVRAARRLCGP
jgi:hypothetical protein